MQEKARRRAQRRYRERGRQVAVVLRDPAAIAALGRGVALHGGPLAAITAALIAAFGPDDEGQRLVSSPESLGSHDGDG